MFDKLTFARTMIEFCRARSYRTARALFTPNRPKNAAQKQTGSRV